ncbi:DUF1257 domain-containing protein [Actinomadura darangshiensis]|uniref:DUF1257 domain-containing protein n=1 Tax=Actinomadura darangshiensis TaxID=705336 RepID=A0A4R5BUP2_9ACTN|nr:DUF1257 domain-containing protein [Actinomadura darangshiensis]TDD87952.1 DUF1257 domain-containing protein [Actinomadura darangshiensis]
MSHFTTLTTEITDREALCAALADVGYEHVEVHDTSQPLYGYRGDLRSDRAHVIVRRAHIGRASNDLGFLHQEDGRYLAVISEYDRRKHDGAWLGRVTARHAYHLTASTLASQGFDLTEETTERDGTVRMVLRRFR